MTQCIDLSWLSVWGLMAVGAFVGVGAVALAQVAGDHGSEREREEDGQ